MRRIGLAVALVFSLALASLVAEAQQASRTYRIGFVATTSRPVETSPLAYFRRGLRDPGYVEDRNLVIAYRWADDKHERLSDDGDRRRRLLGGERRRRLHPLPVPPSGREGQDCVIAKRTLLMPTRKPVAPGTVGTRALNGALPRAGIMPT